MRALPAAALAACLAACYAPATRECSLLCGPDGACPEGATCESDGFCHPAGSTRSCRQIDGAPDGAPADARPADAPAIDAPPPDARPPDARPPDAPWACPPGNTCDDNNVCTSGDHCNASGTCVGTPANALVYRYTDAAGDWVHTTSTTPPPGFSAAGAPFRLAPSPADGVERVWLYQLYSAGSPDYMLSLDSQEAKDPPFNYVQESIVGAVYAAAKPGASRLVRYVQPSPLRHFSTINAGEVPAGYSADGSTQGWVCPP